LISCTQRSPFGTLLRKVGRHGGINDGIVVDATVPGNTRARNRDGEQCVEGRGDNVDLNDLRQASQSDRDLQSARLFDRVVLDT
jgi:hypothetical protein